MRRRKMRLLFWAMAGILAMVPLMQGCASGAGQQTHEESVEVVQVYEASRFGEVQSVSGNVVSVVLGAVTGSDNASDPELNPNGTIGSEGMQVINIPGFTPGTDEVMFDADYVQLYDVDGVAIDASSIQAGNILYMQGTGDGAGFVPQAAQLVTVTAATS